MATTPANRSSEDWFCLGVAWGFAGNGLDNLYWGIAWSASFVGSPWALSLFMFGALPNIIFRQWATSYAGYCHCRAYEVAQGSPPRALRREVLVTSLCGVAYVVLAPLVYRVLS